MENEIEIGVTTITNLIEVTAQPNDQIVDIGVTDNTDEVVINVTPSVIEININKGGLNSNIVTSVNTKIGDVVLTKEDIGLGNVDNTADYDKMISLDTQIALNEKADLVDGVVPSYQLPSYVDDVLEVANYAALPLVGEVGKIYVTLDNNKIYRWSGSIYIEIASNNAIWGAITGTLSNQLDLQNALNAKVPYTGATSNVNLGEYGLSTGNIQFDTTPTVPPTTVGSLSWNDIDGTLNLSLKGESVTLQIGQETVARIVNKTATNITLLEANYQAVRVTGAQGQRPKVDLAQANSDLNSTTTLGLVTETILNNEEGFITTSGQVRQINTTGSLQGETWLDGDILYLSGTVAGRITNIKPIAPIHTVIIGFVEYAHAINGKIFVKVDNGYELEELHNVSAIAPNNNEVLTYDLATTLWKPKTVISALEYTPANDSNVVHLTGTETITGSKIFSLSPYLETGSYLKQVVSFSYPVGYSSINGIANGILIAASSTKSAQLNMTNLTGLKTFEFPNLSGTLALTSDLSSYVPTSRTLTINGVTQDLSANRTFTISAGISGSGTIGKIPLFTGTTAIGDSNLEELASYFNMTKPLNINYSIATGGAALLVDLNNVSSTGTTLFLHNAGTGNLMFAQKADNTQAFLIAGNGNVSIGNVTGNSKLQINGNAAIGYSSPTTAPTNGLVVDGNVGIGTTSPSGKLNVFTGLSGATLDIVNQLSGSISFGNGSGSTTAPTIVCKSNSNTALTFIAATNDTNTTGDYIFNVRKNDNTDFTTLTSSAFKFSRFATSLVDILRNGNVGIGTTTPTYKLQISTDSAAKPTTALWTIASDARIKENINKYTKGLNELLKINPITYDYNGLGGFEKGKGGVGIIAQEIAEILPDSVSSIKGKLNETDEEEIDILNFNGHELTYVLINAVKELKAEIELLKSKLI